MWLGYSRSKLGNGAKIRSGVLRKVASNFYNPDGQNGGVWGKISLKEFYKKPHFLLVACFCFARLIKFIKW